MRREESRGAYFKVDFPGLTKVALAAVLISCICTLPATAVGKPKVVRGRHGGCFGLTTLVDGRKAYVRTCDEECSSAPNILLNCVIFLWDGDDLRHSYQQYRLVRSPDWNRPTYGVDEPQTWRNRLYVIPVPANFKKFTPTEAGFDQGSAPDPDPPPDTVLVTPDD
jgi:hypothetical protein